MTMFWIAAALMLLAALALLLPGLLRRRATAAAGDARSANLQVLREQLAQLDGELAAGTLSEEQHRLSRAEIERRALEEDRGDAAPTTAGRASKTALLLGLCVPLLAVGLYTRLGSFDALQPRPVEAAAPEVSREQIEGMVEQLAKKMETWAGQPDELEGWVLLARSYSALQRYADAGRAYERASALAPQNAQLLADRADVLAMLASSTAVAEDLVQRALQIDPNNLKALALAGSAAFQRQDFAGALKFWGRARELAPADSEFARSLDRSLVETRSAAGAPAAAPPAEARAAAAPAVIRGVLRLAPALAAQVAPTDTVFIFARAAEGPRMPLAIVRGTAAQLPLAFTLDDGSAMSPDFKLSKFERVVVGARISKSGSATPSAGDLIGQAGPLAPGEGALELLIDRVQP